MWKIEILGVGGHQVYWIFASSLEGAKDTAKKLYSILDSEIIDVVEHNFFRHKLTA